LGQADFVIAPVFGQPILVKRGWRRAVPKNLAGDQAMTTNRILQLLPMAAMCLLFTSCFDSKVPLSDPAKSKADERLVGVWRLRNDDGACL
jgi:hypothetical protein